MENQQPSVQEYLAFLFSHRKKIIAISSEIFQ